MNEHYQKMIDVLEQLVEVFPNLKGEEFKLHRLRLQELQASTNIGLLETLLWGEIELCDLVRRERFNLERKNQEKVPPDGILSHWMEDSDRGERTEE
jgi:hypothetical protein